MMRCQGVLYRHQTSLVLIRYRHGACIQRISWHKCHSHDHFFVVEVRNQDSPPTHQLLLDPNSFHRCGIILTNGSIPMSTLTSLYVFLDELRTSNIRFFMLSTTNIQCALLVGSIGKRTMFTSAQVVLKGIHAPVMSSIRRESEETTPGSFLNVWYMFFSLAWNNKSVVVALNLTFGPFLANYRI